MQAALERFLTALRGADVPLSVREAVEAHEAAALVGFGDRGVLKEALGATVAKTLDEKRRFDDCFELFFANDMAQAAPPPEPAAEDAGGIDQPLARMVLDADMGAIAAAMAGAAAAVGADRIRFLSQRGFFARRMLDSMGLRELEALIGRTGDAATAQALERGRSFLLAEARQFVERQYAIYGEAASERLREEALENARLSSLEQRDLARMRRIVRRLAKRLADRHARRARVMKRGRLDAHRTLRANAGFDGVPFNVVWKRRRPGKPKVVAICDVSRSVQATARFLLLFLHALHELLDDARAFAFSDRLVEVGDLFEGDDPERAILRVLDRIGFRPTDYGQAFEDFREQFFDALDRRTTVIVLGDGRSNYGDPKAEIFREIRDRARRVVWLNPEPKAFWGSGDSEMRRYAPHCTTARTCNTVKHLERAVDDLLKTARR